MPQQQAVPCFLMKRRYGAHTEEEFDAAPYIMDLVITHEDVEGDGAGRDLNTGIMIRNFIASKHTYDVKLCPVDGDTMAKISSFVRGSDDESNWTGNVFYLLKTLHPCSNAITHTSGGQFGGWAEVYTSSINYGSQQYDPATGKVWYRGASFKAVQR